MGLFGSGPKLEGNIIPVDPSDAVAVPIPSTVVTVPADEFKSRVTQSNVSEREPAVPLVPPLAAVVAGAAGELALSLMHNTKTYELLGRGISSRVLIVMSSSRDFLLGVFNIAVLKDFARRLPEIASICKVSDPVMGFSYRCLFTLLRRTYERAVGRAWPHRC